LDESEQASSGASNVFSIIFPEEVIDVHDGVWQRALARMSKEEKFHIAFDLPRAESASLWSCKQSPRCNEPQFV
jgi:hypothetical protein